MILPTQSFLPYMSLYARSFIWEVMLSNWPFVIKSTLDEL